MREISGSPARTGRRYAGRNGVTVPGWFARELRLIDGDYYVEWDNHGYYKIQLDVYQLVDVDGKIRRLAFPLTRAVFDDFDRRVLDDLTKRKWINRHFRTNARYYAWLKQKEREKKEKIHEESVDMMAEGVMKMDRMERTKTFT